MKIKKVFALVIIILIVIVLLTGCERKPGDLTQVSIRLEWIPQAQFAGFYVALEKGWYKEAGLDVRLNPAGPDLKPVSTVASGSDHFGVGRPHQIIAARSSDVPLVMITHIIQDTDLRYVAKRKSGIKTFSDVIGKKVGLWLGGDEFEFLAMLKAAGISKEKVQIVPQEFEVTPFLEDKIDVSEVTIYNELNVIQREGVPLEELVIFSAQDFGVALAGAGLFTTERLIAENPDLVQAIVNQSLKGWKYALEYPNETINILLKYNPDLTRTDQVEQLKAIAKIIWIGPTLEGKLGYIDSKDFITAQNVLLQSGQLREPIQLESAYTLRFWEQSPDEYKVINPDKQWLGLE